MALPALNPPKTLNKKLQSLNSPFFSFSKTASSPKITKFKKYPLITMSSQQQNPLPHVALTSNDYKEELMSAIKSSITNCLSETHLDLTVPQLKSKIRGKVRDIYDGGDYLVMVTTDRQSAFDRILASIPFKGQVLNETSLWWFNKTQHITPNAVVSVPDKNVTIARKCSVFPVEFVVRGYVTGSTDTSLWTVYNKGVRNYCGNNLPDGVVCLVKNQKLTENILTPTTKAADHDVPVTPDEIVQRGLMTQADYDEVSRRAMSLFEFGQIEAVLGDRKSSVIIPKIICNGGWADIAEKILGHLRNTSKPSRVPLVRTFREAASPSDWPVHTKNAATEVQNSIKISHAAELNSSKFLSQCLIGIFNDLFHSSPNTDVIQKWFLNRRQRGLWQENGFRMVEIDSQVVVAGGQNEIDALISEFQWDKALGIPLHAWSESTFKVIGNMCGGFVDTDEDTKRRNHLYWARICVKKSGTVLPNKIKLEVGDWNFDITILMDTHAKFWVAGNSKSSVGDSIVTNDGKREASSLALLKFTDRLVGQHVICPELSKFWDGVGPSTYKDSYYSSQNFCDSLSLSCNDEGNLTPTVIETSKWTKLVMVKACKAFGVNVTGFEHELLDMVFRMEQRRQLQLQQKKRVALDHGLILVDTKYEFGKGPDGQIYLIDEVHTPDSSRYWIAHSYQERFQNGLEPENIDKEFLRLWFKSHCNPYEDEVLPDAPEELVSELAWRYIFLFETITNSRFEMPGTKEPVHDRISRNVSQALSSLQ
ncbi:hypothetical protein RDI58_001982 [Solanum bulbocastanum]|uniref:phosphoribosylaminoimidazolesuccinocarboxamide synthase n=1 Tax=Solanum bulbocastanum TaxID=147425 RepID=A0AAN8UAK4_SOLBU